ncbi:Quinone-oxidoreductase like protein [Verticillium longisporum]|nr:Quinone-oxidoreductase like protein [Verticillium longisporum]
MKAWQFTAHGPITKTLRLATDVPRPDAASLQPGQVLVKVASAGLNPVDYKMPELGLAARAMFSFPKIPCGDLSGTVVAIGEGVEGLKAGDHVVGWLKPFSSAGALSEYAVLDKESCVRLGDGADLDEAAGALTTGLTALQSIQPYVKAGDRVFINGGSGGTGTHGIQIAKLLGCHVTVSCSTAKVDFCRGLGADEVIDYKKEDVVASLIKQGGSAGTEKWALIVDNIGNSPTDLYKRSHEVDSTSDSDTASNAGSDAVSSSGFLPVGRAESHEQRATWEEYVFTAKDTDTRAAKSYLEDLFRSSSKDVEEAFKRFTDELEDFQKRWDKQTHFDEQVLTNCFKWSPTQTTTFSSSPSPHVQVLSRPQTVPPYVGPPVELPSDTGQRQYQSGYFAEQASPQHQHVQTSMPAHEVNGLPKADVAWVPHVSMAQVSPGHQRSATTTGVSPMHSPGLQPGQQQHLQQQYQQQQQQQRQQYSPATPGSEQSLSNGLPRDSNSAWSEGDGGMSPRHETYYHR